MSNMGYCKFRNTLNDLRDCNEDFDNHDLSDSEKKARLELYDLCKDIVNSFLREELE